MIIRSENDVERYIDKMYEGYNDFETKSILLVETRGIASYDKQKIIYSMIEYINNEISNRKENLAYVNGYYRHRKGVQEIAISTSRLIINIPKKITEEFKEFKDLYIKVKVRDLHGNINPKYHINSSIGSNCLYNNNKITSGKLNVAAIEIICDSINGKLIVSDFYDSFNHEYNHAYEEYKRSLNKEKNKKIKSGYELNKYTNNNFKLNLLNSSNKNEKSFGWILYLMWDKSEFNAWATSSYSFLKSIESQRHNFAEDIKYCDAFEKYMDLKNIYLPSIKNCDDGDLWIYVYNIVTKENINVFRNKQEVLKQLNQFKLRFIKKTESLIDKFWIKLCKTASLYYDEIENI